MWVGPGEAQGANNILEEVKRNQMKKEQLFEFPGRIAREESGQRIGEGG